MFRTPHQRKPIHNANAFQTPPMQASLRNELKEALRARNMLTAKSKNKVLSMLEELSSPEDSPCRPIEMRRRAIDEILSTERSYIHQLELLMEYFVKPLKEKRLIDDGLHTQLFGQLEMIYNLNRELLKELEANRTKIVPAFLKLAPFFKLYSVYAFDYKNSLLLIQELTKNAAFKKFIDDTETRPEVQTKLNALLIVPIQRVPRYRLLLQQVQLYTSPSEEDYKPLTDSIKQIEGTIEHINSVIEEQEHTQSILNLQNSLVGRLPSIVKPSRKIIKEGMLLKAMSNGNSTRLYCVLMSDIFMFCKPLKKRSKDAIIENSLQCLCVYPLKKSKVVEMFSANFKVSCQGEGVIFHADNDFECRQWVNSIKETIEVHIECRKTLRKESSKRKPLKRKELKYFEAEEALLSPRSKKAEFENIYRPDDFSDLDETKRSDCLALPKILKRKAASPSLSASTPSKRPFSLPSSSNRFSFLYSWFGPNSRPQSIDKAPPEIVDDPTYGFAARGFTDTSYCRTNNIDLSIATDKSEASGEFMDVLYPLRESTGSNKSLPTDEPNEPQVKRVKFNSKPVVDAFKVPQFRLPPQESSIKQKISDFFARLTQH